MLVFGGGALLSAVAVGGIQLFQSQQEALARMMTFCAGGILYIVFNSIAPKTKLEHPGGPSMGVLLGFLAGMIGRLLTH